MHRITDWMFDIPAAEPTPVALAVRLTAAIAFGLVVAAIDRGSRGRGRIAASFPGTLAMLCVLIAMVTQVIGENVALAFSLVGALSIVRFRTVVQDTKDTAFVIFAVAVGMAFGAGQPLVALCGTVAAGSVALIFRDRPDDRSGRGGHPFELTIRTAVDAHAEPQVQAVLTRHGATAEPVHCDTAKKATALRTVYRTRLPHDAPAHGLSESSRRSRACRPPACGGSQARHEPGTRHDRPSLPLGFPARPGAAPHGRRARGFRDWCG